MSVRTVFLKSRQCRASQAAAALATATARSTPGADAVIVSPSLQQSKEVLQRARNGLYQLEEPLTQDSTGLLRLKSGSRLISLAGNARAVRGYSPALVVADEASWILDDTYAALPAAAGGLEGSVGAPVHPGRRGHRLVLRAVAVRPRRRLAAPRGARDERSVHHREFLAKEQRELRPEVFAAEYGCTFTSAAAGGGTLLFPDLERLFIDPPGEATA